MHELIHEYTVGSYIDYQRVVETKDVKRLRVKAHFDSSYPFQSTAVVELWTPVGWVEVHRPLVLGFKTLSEKASIHTRDREDVNDAVLKQADAWLQQALKIVGVSS